MLSWFQALMPKEDRFFDLFERRAETLVGGISALCPRLDDRPDFPERCRNIKTGNTKPMRSRQRRRLPCAGSFLSLSIAATSGI